MSRTLVLLSIFAVLFFFATATQAIAAAPSFPHWGPLLLCNEDGCNDFCDILLTAQSFIYLGLTLVVLVFAPIMIAIGGFLILTAGASEENFKKGKSMLYGAVTGVAVALLAWVVVNTFLTFLDKGKGKTDVSWGTITCEAPPRPRSGYGVSGEFE